MVYVTGDMHGDETRLYDSGWRRLKKGDTLIICGDFGFLWNNTPREKEALEYLGSRKFSVAFLDGTHENFELLQKCRDTVWHGGYAKRVCGNLFNLKRGQIYNIEGLKIFTFGGGESDDRDIRIEQGLWFREEMPSAEEFKIGAQNLDDASLEVDYILTHEPPQLIKSSMQLRAGREEKVSSLNGFLQEIANTCSYKHWFFGSMHEDRRLTEKFSCVFQKTVDIRNNGEELWK